MHDSCRQGQLSLFYTLYGAKSDLNISNSVRRIKITLFKSFDVSKFFLSPPFLLYLATTLYIVLCPQNGATPLHLAAKYGHTELVRYLCSARCDLEAVTEHGFTADEVATNSGHDNLATLIHHLRQVKRGMLFHKLHKNITSSAILKCFTSMGVFLWPRSRVYVDSFAI